MLWSTLYTCQRDDRQARGRHVTSVTCFTCICYLLYLLLGNGMACCGGGPDAVLNEGSWLGNGGVGGQRGILWRGGRIGTAAG